MNNISAVKPNSCKYCGKSFGRRYNLRRHAESVHAEEVSKMNEVDDDLQSETSDGYNSEPDFKKRRFGESEVDKCETESTQDEDEGDSESETESETEKEEDELTDESESGTEVENDESSDEEESSSELEDNAAYRDWLEEAKGATEEMWSEKYEKYVNGGMDEAQAKEKANRKTLWAVKRIFLNNYEDFLSSYLHLKDDDTHLDIVEDIEEKVNNGMEVSTAVNRVVAKHQAKFDGLFQQDD